MPDNNINHDPNETQNGDSSRNDPEKKEIPKGDTDDSSSEQDATGSEDSEIIKKENEISINSGINDPEEKAAEDISSESPEPPPAPLIQTISTKPKESNYQISLVDENLLKVIVTTGKVVRIDSTVKEDHASTETQSNEINLHPRVDFSIQEVEVLIAIDEIQKEHSGEVTEQIEDESAGPDLILPETSDTAGKDDSSKSNYQLNLINENLLKIKILTNKSVRIESVARDKKIRTQLQSNKIILTPKSEKEMQKIEITIAIEAAAVDDRAIKTEDGKSILIPNPEVVDLIRPPDYSNLLSGSSEYPAGDEYGYQNPFDSLRKLIRKNLTIGIIAAIILHGTVAALAFYTISKKTKEAVPEEPTRLIVLQDLPDPKIKIEDVEDPNKPKIEEPVIIPPEKTPESDREITPRRTIKPPTITRPKREEVKLDSSVEANLTRELDSLRKLVDETVPTDTSAADTSQSAYEIPDSLKNNFSENDIGLAMNFPKNWKLIDQRDINKNEKDFVGVMLADTTAEQPGTMTMFISLDNENKYYNAEDFKTEFKMNDSTLTVFVKEPKTVAGFTEYKFYIFNKLGTEKLLLTASVRKQFFDQYKNEIEAVVRSVSIKKKEDIQ